MTVADEESVDAAYWATSLIATSPGRIELRGYPIQELIGRITFPDVIHLLLLGELPSPGRRALLEAALVSAVDHGPHAPSIATARMAATCGVDYNGIIAAGVSLLGDVHGGAGQQCMEFLYTIVDGSQRNGDLAASVKREIEVERRRGYIPGFGHRFHPVDPRAVRLRELLGEARRAGDVSGRYLDAALEVERRLGEGRARPIPLNIDGATAVVYAELGFAAPLGRALFAISRSVGIVAESWEEMQKGMRNKGPIPAAVRPRYDGPLTRHLG